MSEFIQATSHISVNFVILNSHKKANYYNMKEVLDDLNPFHQTINKCLSLSFQPNVDELCDGTS